MIAAHLTPADSLQTMKRTLRSRRWAPSIAAVAAFGALGGSVAYWALQLLAPPVAIAPAGSLVDTHGAPDLGAAQALFGSASSEPSAAISAPVDVRVLGVAASPVRGSAVLVVDSGAAQAFLVGDDVGADLRLVEVHSDAAVLEHRGVRIELPAPQRPSVALLSSGPAPGSASSAEAAPAREAAPAFRAGPSNAAARQAARAGEAAPPDDPAIEAATLSPQGASGADAPRAFGIRASSMRNLGTPDSAAPAGDASD